MKEGRLGNNEEGQRDDTGKGWGGGSDSRDG